MRDYSHRHPATQKIMRWFEFDHLPEGTIRHTAHVCAMHADGHVSRLPDGPELTTGLRKLLEAKDCLVRSAIDARAGERCPHCGRESHGFACPGLMGQTPEPLGGSE